MFVLAAAASYILEWLWTLTGRLLSKNKVWQETIASWGRAFSIIGFSLIICYDGNAYAESEKMFNEQLEGVRYVFDYLETAYQPGDIIIFQAEPNSWVHKNCLYEQSLRPKTKDWIVSESIYLPFMKDKIKKKGSYVWWILMYRPQAGFKPYFYHEMRAFGSDVNDKNAMIMKRHGALTSGRNMEEAYNRMEELEFQAQLQMLVGRAKGLPRTEVDKLRNM